MFRTILTLTTFAFLTCTVVIAEEGEFIARKSVLGFKSKSDPKPMKGGETDSGHIFDFHYLSDVDKEGRSGWRFWNGIENTSKRLLTAKWLDAGVIARRLAKGNVAANDYLEFSKYAVNVDGEILYGETLSNSKPAPHFVHGETEKDSFIPKTLKSHISAVIDGVEYDLEFRSEVKDDSFSFTLENIGKVSGEPGYLVYFSLPDLKFSDSKEEWKVADETDKQKVYISGDKTGVFTAKIPHSNEAFSAKTGTILIFDKPTGSPEILGGRVTFHVKK